MPSSLRTSAEASASVWRSPSQRAGGDDAWNGVVTRGRGANMKHFGE